jgi:hypothetical protein
MARQPIPFYMPSKFISTLVNALVFKIEERNPSVVEFHPFFSNECKAVAIIQQTLINV